MPKFKKVTKKIKSLLEQRLIRFAEKNIGDFYFRHKGFCPCCEQKVVFISRDSWLRDNFKCSNCGCIPRERALMLVIENEFPDWKELSIHESSPGRRGHSVRLKKNAAKYTATHFFSNSRRGEIINNFRNENLENQTFEDEMFDLVITSDVMEHIYDPAKAVKEIHRTLKTGGAHIFSVPLINKHKKTQRWANLGENGQPDFLFTAEWHGNPIDKKGSPVTMHWGYDIVDFIKNRTNSECWIEYIDNLDYGIRAEYIEIVVAKK